MRHEFVNKILVTVLVFFSLSSFVKAAATYDAATISKHNNASDCWVIFQNSVFDITQYLNEHDNRYYYINSWCGTDISSAFVTKDGRGIDHNQKGYAMLASYQIGSLATATNTPVPVSPQISVSAGNSLTTAPTLSPTIAATVTAVATTNKSVAQNPYDFFTPFLFTFVLYWGWDFVVKRNPGKKILSRTAFNSFWNTALVISLLPSAGFGVFMIAKYSFPELRNINFDFLYWHVEGSVVFGTATLCHLLNRLTVYLAQLKFLTRK
jgi:cytochrome b involved in lipid metabolism